MGYLSESLWVESPGGILNLRYGPAKALSAMDTNASARKTIKEDRKCGSLKASFIWSGRSDPEAKVLVKNAR
jgi:hypothetical protein